MPPSCLHTGSVARCKEEPAFIRPGVLCKAKKLTSVVQVMTSQPARGSGNGAHQTTQISMDHHLSGSGDSSTQGDMGETRDGGQTVERTAAFGSPAFPSVGSEEMRLLLEDGIDAAAEAYSIGSPAESETQGSEAVSENGSDPGSSGCNSNGPRHVGSQRSISFGGGNSSPRAPAATDEAGSPSHLWSTSASSEGDLQSSLRAAAERLTVGTAAGTGTDASLAGGFAMQSDSDHGASGTQTVESCETGTSDAPGSDHQPALADAGQSTSLQGNCSRSDCDDPDGTSTLSGRATGDAQKVIATAHPSPSSSSTATCPVADAAPAADSAEGSCSTSKSIGSKGACTSGFVTSTEGAPTPNTIGASGPAGVVEGPGSATLCGALGSPISRSDSTGSIERPASAGPSPPNSHVTGGGIHFTPGRQLTLSPVSAAEMSTPTRCLLTLAGASACCVLLEW